MKPVILIILALLVSGCASVNRNAARLNVEDPDLQLRYVSEYIEDYYRMFSMSGAYMRVFFLDEKCNAIDRDVVHAGAKVRYVIIEDGDSRIPSVIFEPRSRAVVNELLADML